MSTTRTRTLSNYNEHMRNYKLSNSDVREIRKEYKKNGITQAELAEEYGVSTPAISRIVNRRTYRDVR